MLHNTFVAVDGALPPSPQWARTPGYARDQLSQCISGFPRCVPVRPRWQQLLSNVVPCGLYCRVHAVVTRLRVVENSSFVRVTWHARLPQKRRGHQQHIT
eukprot:5628477-Lingulodinium_polyedra.AAC.1